LKPNGLIFGRGENGEKIAQGLKLTGFSSITQGPLNNFTAQKPNFEVGASSKLSFGSTNNKPAAAVWSLSDALVDDQVELVNEDDLLDESDLIKPAAESLKGTILFYIFHFYNLLYNMYYCFSLWNNW